MQLNNKPSKRVPNPANAKVVAFKRAEIARRQAEIQALCPKPEPLPRAKDNRKVYNGATATLQSV